MAMLVFLKYSRHVHPLYHVIVDTLIKLKRLCTMRMMMMTLVHHACVGDRLCVNGRILHPWSVDYPHTGIQVEHLRCKSHGPFRIRRKYRKVISH